MKAGAEPRAGAQADRPAAPGGLVVRRVPLDALRPDMANPRSHDEKNLAAIRASLREFGQVEPLVVRKGTGRVIGGNGRLAALRDLGAAECDVVEVDCDDARAAALAVALNRSAELGGWDRDALAETLRGLEGTGTAPEALGFTAEDLAGLLGAPPADVDSAAEEGQLRDVPTRDLPELAWVLAGIPLQRYARADRLVRELAKIPGVVCEVALSGAKAGAADDPNR